MQVSDHDTDPMQFAGKARAAFRFLETEYGFRPVRETAELVRYARGPVRVDVIREVGVNVLIGRRARLRDGPRALWRSLRHEYGVDFPIEYLEELAGKRLDPGRAVATTHGEVEAHLQQLARFVRDNAEGLLINDDTTYRAAAQVSRRRSAELTEWARSPAEG